MFQKIDAGKKGEGLAASYLIKQGYKIIEKNYRTKLGEIDIIADDNGCTSFIEVRSKNTPEFGLPEDTIHKRKQAQITKAALAYIKKFHLENVSCRFDVVCIDNVDMNFPEIRLIKNAFELDSRYAY